MLVVYCSVQVRPRSSTADIPHERYLWHPHVEKKKVVIVNDSPFTVLTVSQHFCLFVFAATTVIRRCIFHLPDGSFFRQCGIARDAVGIETSSSRWSERRIIRVLVACIIWTYSASSINSCGLQLVQDSCDSAAVQDSRDTSSRGELPTHYRCRTRRNSQYWVQLIKVSRTWNLNIQGAWFPVKKKIVTMFERDWIILMLNLCDHANVGGWTRQSAHLRARRVLLNKFAQTQHGLLIFQPRRPSRREQGTLITLKQ